MKKSLLIFILPLLFSCVDGSKNTDNNKTTNNCLVGHDWCYPNCENPNMAWKFSSDGTFSFSTTLFGGNSAWGTWDNLGEKKIELKYTKNTSEREIPNQVINIRDCRTLKIGNTLYKR